MLASIKAAESPANLESLADAELSNLALSRFIFDVFTSFRVSDEDVPEKERVERISKS